MHYEKVIAYLKGRFGDRPMPESSVRTALGIIGITNRRTQTMHMATMEALGLLTWNGMDQKFRLAPPPPPGYASCGNVNEGNGGETKEATAL